MWAVRWAFAALTASPGARAHYNRRRDTGDHHHDALHNLINRTLGQLHHCLTAHQNFREAIAFSTPAPAPFTAAA